MLSDGPSRRGVLDPGTTRLAPPAVDGRVVTMGRSAFPVRLRGRGRASHHRLPPPLTSRPDRNHAHDGLVAAFRGARAPGRQRESGRKTRNQPLFVAGHDSQTDRFPPHRPEPRRARATRGETVSRGLADAIIMTGDATGLSINVEDLKRVKSYIYETPVLIGSGVTIENAWDMLENSDGIIVGTGIKAEGITTNTVDQDRVCELVELRNRVLELRK